MSLKSSHTRHRAKAPVSPRATFYIPVRNVFGAGRQEYQTPSDPALYRNFRVPSRYSEFGDPIFYAGIRGRW